MIAKNDFFLPGFRASGKAIKMEAFNTLFGFHYDTFDEINRNKVRETEFPVKAVKAMHVQCNRSIDL